MEWKSFHQEKGQCWQEYTTCFQKRAAMIGIPINIEYTLLKYISGCIII